MNKQKRTAIKLALSADQSTEICVKGWVRSVRRGKDVGFIALNDGSSFDSLQLVLSPELDNYDQVSRVGTGACISVNGILVESPAAGQKWELQVSEATILGDADDSYPLQKKRHSDEFLRTIAHLRPRTNTFMAVFRVRSLTAFASINI